MPFGPYDDFDDCVAANQDKDDPAAYCAAIKRAVEGNAARGSTFEPIQFEVPEAPARAMGPSWEGVLAIEDELTGDGRMLESGALRWETLPVPLRWVREDVGEHMNAVVVGRIDEVYRDGNLIMGRGVFDAGSEDGLEAARQVAEGLTPGVSVDLDDVSFEIRVAADLATGAEVAHEMREDGMAVVMRVDPEDEIMVTTDARLRAATIVATPAFAEARLYMRPEDDDDDDMAMVEEDDELTAATFQLSDDDRRPTAGMAEDAQRALDWRAEGHAGGEDNTVERARSIAARQPLSVDTIRRMNRFFLRNARYPSLEGFSPGDDGYPSAARVAWGLWGGDAGARWSATLVARMDRMDDAGAITASASSARPPAAWFADPELAGPTPITVTDDGRVYGHLATWGTCHTGFPGECVQPPSSASNYAFFRTGAIRVDDGSEIPVGRITLDTFHAGRRLGASDTAAHYEHTGVAVADVAAGEDPHGIWVSGRIRPGVDEDTIAKLMASPLSGDWRRVGGQLELVAALAVNSPGFPIPRALVAGGAVQSLVSSGVVTAPVAVAEDQIDDSAVMARLLERERRQMLQHRREARAARERLAFNAAAVRAKAAFDRRKPAKLKKHDDEEMAAYQIRTGTFVEWDWQDGTAQGQVERVLTEGQLEVPGTDTVINADPDNPAVLIESWRRVDLEAGTFFEPTGTMVGRRMEMLRRIDPLPERPADA